MVVAYGTRSRIAVGRYTSIAKGVRFVVDAEHNTRWVTTSPAPGSEAGTKGDVRVGNDVWIGAYATILSGVTIGDGAVVGAAAVVSRDVPPYAVVVGNPGRVVKYRFDAETVARLLAIRWWDWPEHRVQAAADLIWSDRVTEFVDLYDPGSELAGPGEQIVTAEVQTSTGRHRLRFPPADAGLMSAVFERHAYGDLGLGRVRSTPVAVDLGAGAGAFALYAVATYPKVTVHCVESNPNALRLLRVNFADRANVSVHPTGTSRAVDAVAVWDALAPDQVDVLRADLADWGDALAALGPRLRRVRMALLVVRATGDLERAAALLPDHTLDGGPSELPAAWVSRFIRSDLLNETTHA